MSALGQYRKWGQNENRTFNLVGQYKLRGRKRRVSLGQRRSADLLAHVLATRNWLSLSHDRPSPLKEHKPYRQINYCAGDECCADNNGGVRRACYTLNTWLRSLRRPLGRLPRLRRCIFEAMPGSFDLALCGALASGPRLGGGGCVLGDVVPDDCAGSAMDESGTLSGFHLRSQPQANRSNAYPA